MIVLLVLLLVSNVSKTTATSDTENDNCAICLDELPRMLQNDTTKVNGIFGCKHSNHFHVSCLAAHVITNLENTQCPLCRALMICNDCQWVTLMKQMKPMQVYGDCSKLQTFFMQNHMNSSLSMLKQISLEFEMNASRVYFDMAKNCTDLNHKEFYLRYVIALEPNHLLAHFSLGELYLDEHNLHFRALYHFSRALQIDSNAYLVHYKVAQLFLQIRRDDRAIHHFQEVLRVKFDHFYAHYFLGKLLSDYPFAEFKRAIYHFENALKSDPNSYDIHMKIAFLSHFRTQNFTLAKYHYDWLFTKMNPNFVITCRYAYLLSQMGYYQQSEHYLSRIMTMSVRVDFYTLSQHLHMIASTVRKIIMQRFRIQNEQRRSWIEWRKERQRKRPRES